MFSVLFICIEVPVNIECIPVQTPSCVTSDMSRHWLHLFRKRGNNLKRNDHPELRTVVDPL